MLGRASHDPKDPRILDSIVPYRAEPPAKALALQNARAVPPRSTPLAAELSFNPKFGIGLRGLVRLLHTLRAAGDFAPTPCLTIDRGARSVAGLAREGRYPSSRSATSLAAAHARESCVTARFGCEAIAQSTHAAPAARLTTTRPALPTALVAPPLASAACDDAIAPTAIASSRAVRDTATLLVSEGALADLVVTLPIGMSPPDPAMRAFAIAGGPLDPATGTPEIAISTFDPAIAEPAAPTTLADEGAAPLTIAATAGDQAIAVSTVRRVTLESAAAHLAVPTSTLDRAIVASDLPLPAPTKAQAALAVTLAKATKPLSTFALPRVTPAGVIAHFAMGSCSVDKPIATLAIGSGSATRALSTVAIPSATRTRALATLATPFDKNATAFAAISARRAGTTRAPASPAMAIAATAFPSASLAMRSTTERKPFAKLAIPFARKPVPFSKTPVPPASVARRFVAVGKPSARAQRPICTFPNPSSPRGPHSTCPDSEHGKTNPTHPRPARHDSQRRPTIFLFFLSPITFRWGVLRLVV